LSRLSPPAESQILTATESKAARARACRERHNRRHREQLVGCRRCALRAAWQAGKFDHRQRRGPARPDAWDPDAEDTRLAELVGHHTPKEIAEIHRLDQIVRTETAVLVRIKRRGLSRWMVGYRLRDVERLFQFDHRAIHRRWLEPGLMVPTRTFNGRGTARENYVFTDDDLLRFVCDHPWAYERRRMRPVEELPRHLQAIARRLRTEAESVWRSDPYLTRDEFIHEMGWQSKQPWWYWASRRHLIPHRLRWHVWPASSGCRNTGQPLIRVRDLPEIREALERARAQGRHQLGARWRGKPAHNRGQKTIVRRLKVLRCWTCRQLIVRRWRLPLYDPDCGGLAWRPQDVPSLTVWQSNRGGWFVSRWPVDEPSRRDHLDDPTQRCRSQPLAG